MIEWIASGVLGGLIRMLEAAASAAPTLLVGLLIAAVLRYYLAGDGTRKLFGGDSLRSLPQSWAVGMLLPVCSIGVLPILMEMRRARVKPGAMSAFALSAPLFNPLSLLYGLTLSRPYVVLGFAFGSLLVVTGVGWFWDRFAERSAAGGESASESEADGGPIGSARLIAVATYVARQLAGPVGVWSLVALTGLVLLSVVLPFGAMQSSVERDDWWAPLKMTGVAVPAYATPMLAMSQLGMMFQHANSPGAAFTLLVLGTGINVATVVWLGRQFGRRSVTIWLGSVVAIVLGISYAINRPLIPPGVEPAGHTHAFDIYTNPIHRLDTRSLGLVLDRIFGDVSLGEQAAVIAVALVVIAGTTMRLTGFDASQSSGDPAEAELPPAASFDRVVSPKWVGATMLVGLIAVSVVMCYAYYPEPAECLEEIRIARAEAISGARSGDLEHSLYWLAVWDEWSRRLEVGTFLRHGTVRPYQRMQGYLIRKKLELLEHELEHDPYEPEEAGKAVRGVLETNGRWVAAFRS